MCSRKWLIVALVACGLASACSDYNTNLSIQTSSSVLTFVSPSTKNVGEPGFTITANGSGFTTGALILWNGTALTTTLVSANQLTAPVPASDLTAAGTVKVSVQIPGSAQSATSNVNNTTTTEVSNIVLFTINTVAGTPPAITSLSASTTLAASTPYCSSQGFMLTVNGTNFTSDAVVNWNGAVQTTVSMSATQLTASVPAANTALAGTANITVSNSLGTSNSLPLTLATPAGGFPPPTIASVSPTTVGAGSPALTLAVQGGVLPCTMVQWVDSSNVTTTLPTTYVPAIAAVPASLVATVPAIDLASPGSTNVQLVNPGTTASSRVPFTIATPVISSLSSSTNSSNMMPACSPPGVTLTLNGTGFVSGSVVDWITPAPVTILPLPTAYVSSTQLVATIPALDAASAGMVSIQVTNSGVLSNTLPFTISASSPPAPANISISQTSATAGAASFPLTVNGTNLLPCSVVQWTIGSTTTQLATTYVGPTQSKPAQLVATVPAAAIASVGTAQVAVASPAASTNTSTQIPFSIGLATLSSLSASTTSSDSTPNCSSAGFTLALKGTGFANGIVVNWNGSPRPTTLMSATQLNAAITPADTAFQGTGAAAVAITVTGSSLGTNSNSLKFSVNPLATGTNLPSPVISSILPTNAAVEALTGPPVPLTVNGSSLSPCSVVQWNGASLPTSIFIGTSGMASVIPAANITTITPVVPDQVSVTTPAPGGGTSGNEPFVVYAPGSPGTNRITGGALSLPLMSSDQRYAVYVLASATDGVTEIPGSTQNIFVSDTCTGVASGCTPAVTLVSAWISGTAANADSTSPSISADGRYVSFLSSASNLVAGDVNGVADAFVRDTCAGVSSGCTPSTQLVSVTTGGVQANGATTSATIDATGRYITFESVASNLGSISSSGGIFLRDTCAGAPAGCTASTQPLN
jgi:trimeric autotransporter adhesin